MKRLQKKNNTFQGKSADTGNVKQRRTQLMNTQNKRANIAFKCSFCDGGQSESKQLIGFNGACSDDMIRHNIEIER